MSSVTQKLSCKASCKTFFFLMVNMLSYRLIYYVISVWLFHHLSFSTHVFQSCQLTRMSTSLYMFLNKKTFLLGPNWLNLILVKPR
jgi:hypothetical protein